MLSQIEFSLSSDYVPMHSTNCLETNTCALMCNYHITQSTLVSVYSKACIIQQCFWSDIILLVSECWKSDKSFCLSPSGVERKMYRQLKSSKMCVFLCYKGLPTDLRSIMRSWTSGLLLWEIVERGSKWWHSKILNSLTSMDTLNLLLHIEQLPLSKEKNKLKTSWVTL